MKQNYFILVMLCLLLSFTGFAQEKIIGEIQDSNQPIDVGAFDNQLFADVLLISLNNYMDTAGYEGFEAHEFFVAPSKEHAEIMASEQDATLDGGGAYRTIYDRLQLANGTGTGDEVVARSSLREGDRNFTYVELAEKVLFRWLGSGKNSRKILGQKNFFVGIGACLDENKKRVYVSMYMGNYESFMQGAQNVDQLEFAYSTKTYRLKPYEYRTCRKCKRKMPDMINLQQGLDISPTGEIIFKFGNLKTFKKFLRSKKDGLAVDIIQKEQFNSCGEENIVDFGNYNHGIVTKRMWSKKIFKKNIAEPNPDDRRGRVTRLEVVLGQLPEGLTEDDVELNLIVIKDKKVCANIPPSYVDKSIYKYSQKLDLLPDTIVPDGIPEYVPMATSNKLEFRIPFEQAKFDYDSDDMIPVLTALNEPDFIINKIFIKAYSSLEGSEEQNSVLQRKRANSIVTSLEENQNASIVDSIITAPNWEELKKDVMGTKHEELASMKYHEAIEYVNAHSVEMEEFLVNHRYANVTIWVTYNINGDKEQNYVIDQFNKAIEADQLDKALAIQKYIFKRVVESRYNSKAVSEMRIPNGRDYVGLNMNKICLTKFIYLDPIDSTYLEKVDNLHSLDKANQYVEFNDIFCEVKMSNVRDKDVTDDLQDRIEMMYDSQINKKTVDLLNIELQYQIMDVFKDSLGFDHPVVVESLDRIKRIIDFNEINWQNSLKLAGVFVNHGDYEYSFKLLDPWIDEKVVSTTLLMTYISICTKVEYKVYSNNFVLALEKLRKHDPKLFCKLFKGNKLSVQTFANTKVKKMYCDECK